LVPVVLVLVFIVDQTRQMVVILFLVLLHQQAAAVVELLAMVPDKTVVLPAVDLEITMPAAQEHQAKEITADQVLVPLVVAVVEALVLLVDHRQFLLAPIMVVMVVLELCLLLQDHLFNTQEVVVEVRQILILLVG
jgi:hypothetical protein